MYITVRSILKEPVFEDAKVLSGKQFLENKVSRVSVFDCPFTPSVLEAGIIKAGDLFLSGLNQFADRPEQLVEFLTLLAKAKSSALFITDEHPSLISSDIVALSDKLELPIIEFQEDIPYAVIMDTINKLTILEFRHAINGLWLNRLLFENISAKDRLDVLHSINPKFKHFMQIFMLKGKNNSITTQNELLTLFASKDKDSYIYYHDVHYFLLSDSSESSLQKKTQTYKQFLPQFFTDYAMGISMIHDIAEAVSCLRESKLLLDVADTLHFSVLEYASDSLFQLILPLKDTPALNHYRDIFIQKLHANESENGSVLFTTMKEFVLCKGSYTQTASNLNQHENTIRYRINKIRQMFQMEDDPISFYSTISMLTMIDSFYEQEPPHI